MSAPFAVRHSCACPWRPRAFEVGTAVLAGEHAARERRPGNHAESHLARHRDEVALDGPLDEAVLDLQRDSGDQPRRSAIACMRETCQAGVSEMPR